MLEWISTFGVDVKGIITAVLGAFFGAVIKWLLDREEKAQLRTAINAQRCETRSLGERLQATHGRLSEQETANDVKQKELERLSDLLKGKGVDIQKREDRLTKLSRVGLIERQCQATSPVVALIEHRCKEEAGRMSTRQGQGDHL